MASCMGVQEGSAQKRVLASLSEVSVLSLAALSRYLFMLWLGFILGAFSCRLQERWELILTSGLRGLPREGSSFRSMLMNFHSSGFLETLVGVRVFISLVDGWRRSLFWRWSASLPSVRTMLEGAALSLSLNLRLKRLRSCELLLEWSLASSSCWRWQSLRSTTAIFLSLRNSSWSLLWELTLRRWVCSFLRVKTQARSLDFWKRRSMASRISFSFLERRMVGGLMVVGLALQDCLELALEELDLLELLRGRSFSLRALVLKKLKLLSI